MPVYYARAAGNVNAAIWATTPTGTAQNLFPSFTSADILMTNSFAVTFNVSVTVKEIRTDNAYGATDGGSGSLTNGITITADLYAGATNVVFSNQTFTGSATIVGTLYGGYGSSGSAVAGLHTTSTGTLTVVGDCYGPITNNGSAVSNASTNGGVVNVVGNVYGRTAWGATLSGTGTLNITGNVFGGNGSQNAIGLGVSGGTASVVGTSTGGLAGAGVSVSNSAATVTVARAKGGPLPNSTVGVAAAAAATVSHAVTVNSIEYGDTYGASPTSGPIRFPNSTAVVAFAVLPTGSKKLLADSTNTALYPAASDVRSGTTYAASSTGTCAIPAASSVLSGVPVDAGVGTGGLTAAALWNHLTSAATTSGSMGERLANAATVASTGQQIANAVGA